MRHVTLSSRLAKTRSIDVPHEIDGTLDKAVAAATRGAEASPTLPKMTNLNPP
jgi:hypothetical protein